MASTTRGGDLHASDDPRIILVETFKGGTGKTTTSLWTAQALADFGCRTLLVGLSPQNDLVALPSRHFVGLRNAVMTGAEPKVMALADRLWHVPAGTADFGAEDPGLLAAIRIAARAVGASVVVVDGLNFLQAASFWVARGADLLVVPTTPYPTPLAAAFRTLRSVAAVRSDALLLARLLLTVVPSVSERSAATRELLTLLREGYPELVFAQEIRRTARVDNVALDPERRLARGRPTGSLLSADYHGLGRELLALLESSRSPVADRRTGDLALDTGGGW